MATSKDTLRDSVLTSSDVLYDLYCQPCSTEKLHLEAVGFCENCKEYLCDNCLRCHKKLKATQHHTLFDKKTMPTTKITTRTLDTLTETCRKHSDKLLEYFCHSHKELCCSVCLNLRHKSCKQKKKSYVPDVSAGVDKSKEYTDLVKEVGQLVVVATREQLDMHTSTYNNDKYRSKALEDIKQGRERIDKMLDKLVADSVQQVNERHKSNAQIITAASTKCQLVLSNARQMASDLNKKSKEKKNNQLFVDIKLTQSRIPAIQDEMKDVAQRKISRYVFAQDEKVQEAMSSLSAIWSLTVRQDGGDTTAHYMREVCVKTDEDEKECLINGIVVLPGDRLVMTDRKNNAIKLVDTKTNNVTSRLPLSSLPFDVTVTQPGQVAVSLGREKKIEIITVADVMSRSHSINVPGDFFKKLCYDGQHFFLVYPDARAIKKVDMTGRVVSIIFTDSDSDPLFKCPCYITLSRGQDVLYVSDYKGNTVTCLTLSGQVITVYSHAMLKKPAGVAVGGDGRVYVCSKDSHTVHQLTASGKHVTVLLDEEHGLAPWPLVIAYSEDDDTLAISSGSSAPQHCNFVKLFKLE